MVKGHVGIPKDMGPVPQSPPAAPQAAPAPPQAAPPDPRAHKRLTVEQMMQTSYYEVLSVAPGVRIPAIRKAFLKASLIYHPDKGGSDLQFKILSYMMEILTNATTREVYDRDGPASFAAGMPQQMPGTSTGPCNGPSAPVVFEEYINLDMLHQMLAVRGMRQLYVGQTNFIEVLLGFFDRAVPVRKGLRFHAGVIEASWRENPRAIQLGLKGRRLPGKSIDLNAADVGVFPYPKLIRYTLRGGFGDRMQDLDQVNAFFVAMLYLLETWGVDSQFPEVVAMVKDRPAMFAELATGSYDEKKVIFLKVAFQGRLAADMPDAIVRLDRQIKAFYSMVGTRYPEKVAIAESWGKKRPCITVGAYLLMDVERTRLDTMCACVGSAMISPEADGLVTFDASDTQLQALKNSGVDITRKHYPQDIAEVLAYAKKRYPLYDFVSRSKYDWRRVIEARRCAFLELEGDNDVSGHTDYALVVAALTEGQVVLSSGMLYATGPSGLWIKSSANETLHNYVRDQLEHIFGYKRLTYRNGKVGYVNQISQPKRLKDHGFLTSVREEVKAHIAGTPPILNERRELLAFADGTVYNFKTNEVCQCQSDMNISQHLPFAYGEYNVGLQAAWEEVIAEVTEYWRSGGLDLCPEPTSDGPLQFGNPSLAEKVRRVARKCEYLDTVLGICSDNVDEMLYLLQHICRMMSAYPRLCEMLYVHGPKKAGKDLFALILQTFFGDVSTAGFCCSLPRDFFAVHKVDKRGCED